MRHIAFVTRAKRPELTADDALAVSPCAALGLNASAAPWDDPRVDWSAFDAIVLRSCWNYHVRPNRFIAWLRHLRALGLPVLNGLPACVWNMRKSYLLHLARHGVPVLPTVLVPRGARVDTAGIAATFPARSLVVKPVIGASGWQLFRLRPANPRHAERLAKLSNRRAILIQPWLPDVRRNGEWSLVFFEGQFHHSAWKRPAPGDFRVHVEFGGSVDAALAPRAVRDIAESAVRTLPRILPYARVDVVESARGPLVMELELIEPELFLRCHPSAPERFAEVVHAHTSGRPRRS